MRKRSYILFLFAICTFGILGSCQKEPTMSREEIRAQEVQKRVDNFIQNKTEECYHTTMDLAIHRADSILKTNAVRFKIDDLERPPLPGKPAKNLKPAPKDSVKNIPFLSPLEILSDTLLKNQNQ